MGEYGHAGAPRFSRSVTAGSPPIMLVPIAIVVLLAVLLPMLAIGEPAAAQDLTAVRINEVVTSNDSVLAADATTPDWIEVFNPSADTPVDLTNWALSDDATRPQKWVFPAGTSLAPGGYLVGSTTCWQFRVADS